jgi:hypothetical protein
MLIQLVKLDDIAEGLSTNVTISSDTPVDEEYLAYLVKMYQSSEEKNLPFSIRNTLFLVLWEPYTPSNIF